MQQNQDNHQFHITDEALVLIRNTLKDGSGFDLDIYKDKCIRRRIAIRVRATHCRSAEEYGELLRKNSDEKNHLLRVLTIHVSQFFRNPSTFEKIGTEIIPYLLQRRNLEEKESLTIWSVGCAGGEEPYSMALILAESFPEETKKEKIRILATDVDADILETAAKGVYGEERLAEVPDEKRKRWFCLRDGRYHLLPEIKSLVEFDKRDLSDRETFPDCDLILCRNVLIYFERPHQEKILNGFADVLGKGGVLVMGKSETLFGQIRSRFQTVCPVERIYRVN